MLGKYRTSLCGFTSRLIRPRRRRLLSRPIWMMGNGYSGSCTYKRGGCENMCWVMREQEVEGGVGGIKISATHHMPPSILFVCLSVQAGMRDPYFASVSPALRRRSPVYYNLILILLLILPSPNQKEKGDSYLPDMTSRNAKWVYLYRRTYERPFDLSTRLDFRRGPISMNSSIFPTSRCYAGTQP